MIELPQFFRVRQTFDGGFIIAGHTYSFGEGTPEFANFYVVKISSIGDTLWTCTYGGSNEDFAYSVLQTSDSCFILAGQTRSFGAGAGDAYLIKTGPDPTAATEHFIPHPSLFTLSCFPNPFNPSTRISYALPKSGHATLTVFNLLGEQITTLADEIQSAGEHTITFDGSGLASGVYLSRLQSGDFARTQKMLLLK